MDTTWINTIIFGVPILSAIVGQELGLLYPVLASISSFFFQLPFLLICFEMNEVKNPLQRNPLPQTTPTEPNPESRNNSEKKSSTRKCYDCWNFCIAKKNSPSRSGKDVATRIVLRIISNPPIIGIVLGFCWSATGWPLHPILDGFVTNLANVITPGKQYNCFGLERLQIQPLQVLTNQISLILIIYLYDTYYIVSMQHRRSQLACFCTGKILRVIGGGRCSICASN